MRALLGSAKASVKNKVLALKMALLSLIVGLDAQYPTATGSKASAWALLAETRANTEAVRDILIGSILLVVSFVVALIMYPILTSQVAKAQADKNTTSTNSTLIGLIPTIFLIVLIVSGVGFLIKGLRSFGTKGY